MDTVPSVYDINMDTVPSVYDINMDTVPSVYDINMDAGDEVRWAVDHPLLSRNTTYSCNIRCSYE